MESADSANAALEALAAAKKPMNTQEIAAAADLEDHEARASVGLLRNAGLLLREARGAGFVYSINRDLSPFDLIKATEMGINLTAFGEKGGISAKKKQEAFALSTQSGKIKELNEQRQAEKEAARSKSEKAAPRDPVSHALADLISAADKSLGKLKGKSKAKVAIADALSRAKEQASGALEDHKRSLRNEGKE